MNREKVANLMKINSHANFTAAAVCSELASFDVENTCKFLKAICKLPQRLKKQQTNKQKEKHNQNQHNLPPSPSENRKLIMILVKS